MNVVKKSDKIWYEIKQVLIITVQSILRKSKEKKKEKKLQL